VSITVDDTKTGEEFELAVREGERALDVYHHPYAYAAQRRNDNWARSCPNSRPRCVVVTRANEEG
jgi:hypothetical protein